MSGVPPTPSSPSTVPLPRPQPSIHLWNLTAAEIEHNRRYVTVHPENIDVILPWLKTGPANSAWRGYVSTVDTVTPKIDRLFFELALTICQFGGFIAFNPDGTPHRWERDGSGIKALLHTMDVIRADRKLPGIDIHDDLDRELAHYFIDAPFGSQRLAMLKEVSRKPSRRFFDELLQLARRRDGTFRFNAMHMTGLGCRFPLSFGEDDYFYKKASLLLMTMEIALNQLGFRAIAATMPPADYRLPQIMEGLGILKFSEALTASVITGKLFSLNDPEVHAIRAGTVEAVARIKTAYETLHGKEISCAELDGMLYLLSRNNRLMARTTMRPYMRVATHAF